MSERTSSRRRFLRLTGGSAVGALAGCSGGGGGGGTETASPTPTPTATSTRQGGGGGGGGGGSGGSGSGDGLGPVPDQYRTATSQGGVQRNPDALSKKSVVNYQSEPNDGEQCSGCMFFIPDMNGDGLGACAIVEGMIEPTGWCSSFSAYEG